MSDRHARRRAALAALVGAVVALAAAAPAQAITAVNYPVDVGPPPSNGLTAIAAGPDGNVWFAERSGRVGRVSPAGAVTEYAGFPSLLDIAAGPDGRMWFTESTSDGSALGWIALDGSTRGSYTTHPEITGGDLVRLVAGPDGALWFTRAGGSSYTVARMTTTGVLTNFMPSYRPPSLPSGITRGPDGALWYAETGRELAPEFPSPSFRGLGRITTAGTITAFPLRLRHHPAVYPLDVATGPDRALWFTAEPSAIGRMTTSGRSTLFDVRVPRGRTVGSIAAGPDGNLWFTVGGGRVGRITRQGRVTLFRTPSREAGPGDLAVGSGGTLWMTAGSAVVKIVPPRGRCVVPRLVGLRYPRATGRLHRANCTIGHVAAPAHARRARLTVRRQDPRPGTRLPGESSIDLTLR